MACILTTTWFSRIFCLYLISWFSHRGQGQVFTEETGCNFFFWLFDRSPCSTDKVRIRFKWQFTTYFSPTFFSVYPSRLIFFDFSCFGNIFLTYFSPLFSLTCWAQKRPKKYSGKTYQQCLFVSRDHEPVTKDNPQMMLFHVGTIFFLLLPYTSVSQ